MIQLLVNIGSKKINIDLSTNDCNERIDVSERLKKQYIEIIQAIFENKQLAISVECLINNKRYEKTLDVKNITFFTKDTTDSFDLISKIESILLDRDHYEIIIDLNNPFNGEIDITKILKSDNTYVTDVEKFVMHEHRDINLRQKRGYKDIACNGKIILLYEDM